MIIIGIDGGKSGAIAINASGKEPYVRAMPETPAEMLQILLVGAGDCHVFFEKAQAMPKQGVTSMFNYGKGVGILEGMIVALGYAYTMVRPTEWMRHMHAGTDGALGTKERSLQAVYRLFPKANLKPTARCRRDSDGMAEALLIAEYGRRVLQGQTG